MPTTKQGEIIVQDFRGINVHDNAFIIDDSEAQLATNVVVTNGAVEVRGGFEIHAQDLTRTGGIPMMTPFYKRDGTAQLVFANDDDYFYITPSNQTWQTIGSYGTAVDNPYAFQYKDTLVFGTGSTANTQRKWDGTTFSAVTTPANANSDLRFYASFNAKNVRYLVGGGAQSNVANDSNTTLYFTTDPDDWSTGGALQVGPDDGQQLTGLIQNNNLVAYKEKSKHYYDSFYEEFSGTFNLRNFGVDNSSGSPNHESLLPIDGDVVTLTEKSRSIEGYGLEGTAQGNARPKQYATNINPILDVLTWQKDIIAKSRGEFFDRKAWYAVPFNGSQTNNAILVGDWDSPTRNLQPSWTTFARTAGSFAVFRDEDGIDQLYIGDALQPIIYRYNPLVYSDNGKFGYTRRWRSKKYSLFRREDYNDLSTVVISGFMRTITEFNLKIIVDGREQNYLITKDQLVEDGTAAGSYIGDKNIGDEIIGGNSTPTDKFRYLAVAKIPNSVRYCKNVEVEISNSEPGQYWSLDYLSINEKMNYENLPANHKNLIPN